MPSAAANAPRPAAAVAARARAQQAYWRFNLLVIGVMLVLGGTISFVVPLYAPELAALHWRGWSLPYYLGAQGATLLYVLLIVAYIVLMQMAQRRLNASLAAIAAVEAARQSAARAVTPRPDSGAGAGPHP